MRKYIICLFLFVIMCFNIYAQEDNFFIGSWDIILIDLNNIETNAEMIFSNNGTCTLYSNEGTNITTWKLSDKYLFFGEFGYELQITDNNSFYIVPAFGHAKIKKILYFRKEIDE